MWKPHKTSPHKLRTPRQNPIERSISDLESLVPIDDQTTGDTRDGDEGIVLPHLV